MKPWKQMTEKEQEAFLQAQLSIIDLIGSHETLENMSEAQRPVFLLGVLIKLERPLRNSALFYEFDPDGFLEESRKLLFQYLDNTVEVLKLTEWRGQKYEAPSPAMMSVQQALVDKAKRVISHKSFPMAAHISIRRLFELARRMNMI